MPDDVEICMFCDSTESEHGSWIDSHRFVALDPIESLQLFDPIDGFPLFGDDE